ncbi:protein kinase, putative [Trypanosoma cruzi]|uniref:Protein kinase, putative n=1 Tax=Trypanosoma cruzi (strain CL Brener) TaxID=353153 RepID=Q4DA57_TRYCC|nr:protein kinase, putative [Trypanosoma cruzi]EAN89396.1 protein kinase, putative [Trypanosoma cruzi]|eukprot:XP_811247.1 protein kinase [Trypanosoma cruzi strain CL Brener]
MRRQGKNTTKRSMLLRVGSFSLDAERTDGSTVMAGLSPTSGGIITPRRIVRSLNVSPAVTQLVPLDAVAQRPLSTETSATVLSEEVLDDLISESVSATYVPEGSLPLLGVHNGPAEGMTASFDPGNQKSMSYSLTRMTDKDSLCSSSLSGGSSTHSFSHEYTLAFDVESVYSCSLSCVGDAKHGTRSVSRQMASPAATAAETAAAVAAATPNNSVPGCGDTITRDPEAGIVQLIATGDGSNAVEFGRGRRIVNVRREERIGRGGYGDIFRAVDLDTGLPLAIKEILVTADISKDVEKQLRALEREIRVMRKLNHKHIVSYYSARRDESCSALLIYMEYVGGGTIAQKLRTNGPFSEDETRHYTRQLLEGLDYLHQRRIVHRDLKGDNLFLTEDGVLKVGDFGTSKELQTTLVTDSVAGTPNFMAPEVIACSGHTCMADIWSVGCCVLEMLTAHPPFWNLDNHMAVMFAIMKGRLEEQLPHQISGDAKDFIRACLRNDPKERPTAAQLKQHRWLLSKEENEDVGSRVQSCLSLSSLGFSNGDGKHREGQCTTQEGSMTARKDVFKSSTAPVVSIIPDGNNTSGGSPVNSSKSGSKKTGKRKRILDPPAPSTAAKSPSGSAPNLMPPLATPLSNGQLTNHTKQTTTRSAPHANGVKHGKSNTKVGIGSTRNGGVSGGRGEPKRGGLTSEGYVVTKTTKGGRLTTPRLEATTCSTR